MINLFNVSRITLHSLIFNISSLHSPCSPSIFLPFSSQTVLPVSYKPRMRRGPRLQTPAETSTARSWPDQGWLPCSPCSFPGSSSSPGQVGMTNMVPDLELGQIFAHPRQSPHERPVGTGRSDHSSWWRSSEWERSCVCVCRLCMQEVCVCVCLFESLRLKKTKHQPTRQSQATISTHVDINCEHLRSHTLTLSIIPSIHSSIY